jgi:DNA-directed RNA polymerase subunit K/omega
MVLANHIFEWNLLGLLHNPNIIFVGSFCYLKRIKKKVRLFGRVRDPRGEFFLIDDTVREIKSKDNTVLIGEPVLTRYERARVVGARALQVSQGAPVLIEIESDDFRPIEVSKIELKARVLPVGMARRIPSGEYQIIPIQWLLDREFISQIRIDPEELIDKNK